MRFGLNKYWADADQASVNKRMIPRPSQRLVLLVGGFVFLTHMLMGQDLSADSWQQHVRSPTWAIGACLAVLLMLTLYRVSPGIWLVVAGASANLVSWADDGKIPDYMTAVVGDRWIAFNLADVSIMVGALTVMSTLLIHAERQVRGRAPIR